MKSNQSTGFLTQRFWTCKNKKLRSVIVFSKCFLFLTVFLILFFSIQSIFPNEEERMQVQRLYAEEDNEFQVLYVGSSHIWHGVSPMDIYEKYGITGYNLSTSAQSLATTYYAIKEFLKYQKPKLIVVDAASLYSDPYRESQYKYFMDGMKLTLNKICFAYDYAKALLYRDNNTGIKSVIVSDEFVEGLFPLLRYHSEWSNLTDERVFPMPKSKHYFAKGFIMDPTVVKGNYVALDIDAIVKESDFQTQDMPEENTKYAILIRDLCFERDINLLLIKVPSVDSPLTNQRVWYRGKFEATESFCKENDISYYDMQYMDDIGLDPNTDYLDGGWHLNIRGAEKVSDVLGEYISTHYDIEKTVIGEPWNEDVKLYDYYKRVAWLESETDYSFYKLQLESLPYFYSKEVVIDDKVLITVIDSKSGLIIDCVQFDLSDGSAIRDNTDAEGNSIDPIWKMSMIYMNYLIDGGYSL